MVIYVDNINPSALIPPKVSVVVVTYSFQISMLFLTFFNETPVQRHYVQHLYRDIMFKSNSPFLKIYLPPRDKNL